jgi:hypothetical protein
MSVWGQNAKYSSGADVFCFASNIRHRSVGSAGPFGADIVAKVPKSAAVDFSPKNETSDNRRSMGLQTRYQNRL